MDDAAGSDEPPEMLDVIEQIEESDVQTIWPRTIVVGNCGTSAHKQHVCPDPVWKLPKISMEIRIPGKAAHWPR